MNGRPESGRRCFYLLAIVMVMAFAPVFIGFAIAGEYVWYPQTGATGYKLYYSTDNTVTVDDPNVDVGNATQYELCLLPLDPCTTYYIRPAAYNVGGEIFIGSVYEYANNTPQITVTPQAINILHNSATIQWTTDVLATSVVNYGTTTSYGALESSIAYVTGHSIVLTGLAPATAYHFLATSFDPDNCGPGCNASDNSPSGDQVFTTQPAPDLTPPVIISGPTITSITETTATIEWTTDEISTTNVYFDIDGPGEPYDYFSGDSNLVPVHSLTLSGLTPGTDYYCRVGSADAVGNGPTYSGEITFTTQAVQTEVPAPPSGLRVIE